METRIVPEAIIIAGANGAGKMTFARQLIPTLYPNIEFLNADEIQIESSIFSHFVAAGRELLRRLEIKEHCQDSFAIETTLSSTMYAKRIRLWKTCGYHTSLHFIELPAEEFALQRVAMRVAAGGHAISELDVKRRYHRGLTLFQHTYKPIVDEWYHWFSNDTGLYLGEHYAK